MLVSNAWKYFIKNPFQDQTNKSLRKEKIEFLLVIQMYVWLQTNWLRIFGYTESGYQKSITLWNLKFPNFQKKCLTNIVFSKTVQLQYVTYCMWQTVCPFPPRSQRKRNILYELHTVWFYFQNRLIIIILFWSKFLTVTIKKIFFKQIRNRAFFTILSC